MTDEQELTVKAAWQNIVAFLKQVTAIIAGISACGAGLWYLIGGHLGAIADLPETNAAITLKLVNIQADLDAIKLAQATKVRPVVEFHGAAEVQDAYNVKPHTRAFVVYNLRRYEDCTGTVVRRWYNAEGGFYDHSFETSISVQKAPVSTRHRLWRLPLDIPDLPPGWWAYHPELLPGPDCVSDLPITMPPAYFTVTTNE